MSPERYENIRAVVNGFYDAGVNSPEYNPQAGETVSDIFDAWPLVHRQIPDLTRGEFDRVCRDIQETIDGQMQAFWGLA